MAFTLISKKFGSYLIARWVIVPCFNLNFDKQFAEFRLCQLGSLWDSLCISCLPHEFLKCSIGQKLQRISPVLRLFVTLSSRLHVIAIYEFRNGLFICDHWIFQCCCIRNYLFWIRIQLRLRLGFGSGSNLYKVSDPDPTSHFLKDLDAQMLQIEPKQCCGSDTTYFGAGSD